MLSEHIQYIGQATDRKMNKFSDFSPVGFKLLS